MSLFALFSVVAVASKKKLSRWSMTFLLKKKYKTSTVIKH